MSKQQHEKSVLAQAAFEAIETVEVKMTSLVTSASATKALASLAMALELAKAEEEEVSEKKLSKWAGLIVTDAEKKVWEASMIEVRLHNAAILKKLEDEKVSAAAALASSKTSAAAALAEEVVKKKELLKQAQNSALGQAFWWVWDKEEDEVITQIPEEKKAA